MVNESATLRAAISVRTSPGAGKLDLEEAAVMPVMAWLSVRLLTARRILVSESLDEPRSV
jgi:hypothetical protein